MDRRPFVFLDRDGTLLRDDGYTHRIDDYAPLPGAHEAVRRLREAGFGVAVVTNQSGIGRGYFTEDDYTRFEAHLLADFAAHDARIDAVYHCPHRPDEGCACRKPATAMLERAARELGADLARSWVVGDSAADIELARRAGARAVLVRTGQGANHAAQVPAGVAIADDVLAAAHLICHATQSAES